MRLSHMPADVERMIAALSGHAGIEHLRFSPATRSLLVRHRTAQFTTEEIALRVAIALSLDNDALPVRLLAEPDKEDFTSSAVLSGVLLLSAGLLRWATRRPMRRSPADWLAGAGTAYAVLDHAWREVSERGYYDPEVLSLGYLVTAFPRGNLFKASVLTWAATFGRHLFEAPHDGVLVQPVVREGEGGLVSYDIHLTPDPALSQRRRIRQLMGSFVSRGKTGGAYGRRQLLAELNEVACEHGDGLEGTGGLPDGIRLRFGSMVDGRLNTDT